jgi:hypothetical protein
VNTALVAAPMDAGSAVVCRSPLVICGYVPVMHCASIA